MGHYFNSQPVCRICGNSIKNAQTFVPNKAPVVSAFTADYIGSDASYDSSSLYTGMPFLVTVNAADPEGKNSPIVFTSTQGTFTRKLVTDTRSHHHNFTLGLLLVATSQDYG